MEFKNKNITDLYRGINSFYIGYQPTSNLVKDKNGDLFAYSQNISNNQLHAAEPFLRSRLLQNY
jgi:hypothetical protein